MKYFYTGLILLLLLFANHAFAQTPKVQLSESFPEPGDGFDKLVLLPNGNTAYLHFDKKLGIVVTIYNAQHTVAATETVTGALWDAQNLNDTEIDGIYAINGQIVLFLQQLVKYKPNLYRLVLDASTGKLVQEDKLGELPTVLHRDVAVQNNFSSHDFYVVKDAQSDYYAVASFAGGELQRKELPEERIRVMHFSPEHKLIHSAAYYMPGSPYDYYAYLDMSVQGGEKVYVATAALSNRKGSKDSAAIVVISSAGRENSVFAHRTLSYTANFADVHASLQRAAGTNMLHLLLNNTGEADNAGAYINYIDAATLELHHYKHLRKEKVSAFAQQKMKYTGPYSGQPQLLLSHKDGSSTVLFETMSEFASTGTNSWNKMHTNLNDIGVSHLDATGAEQSGYALIKMQVANGTYSPLYLHRKKKGQWIFRNRIQALNTTPYLSFEYIPTPKGTYIIFNDYLQYLDPGGTYLDKRPLRYLTEANAVCYRCDDKQQERLFLFGTPETFKGYYCMLGSSDYGEASSTYVTIMITRKGEERKAQIAWVSF